MPPSLNTTINFSYTGEYCDELSGPEDPRCRIDCVVRARERYSRVSPIPQFSNHQNPDIYVVSCLCMACRVTRGRPGLARPLLTKGLLRQEPEAAHL